MDEVASLLRALMVKVKYSCERAKMVFLGQSHTWKVR
jgi:hypothetical protein